MAATFSADMNVMIRAAEKAARALVRDFGEVEQLQVSRKGPADFVSAADRKAEETLFNELSTARPDFGFLMEERGGVNENAENRWIIDPLDGTTNFLHGLPHWAISIALEKKGEIVAGIVYDPIKDEMFRAERGGGAFMRNRRLRISGRTNAEECVIACADTRRPEWRDIFLNDLGRVTEKFPVFRRYGSAALDLAYVAAGRFDGFWERHLHPWDVAAGMLIVKEAGGYCTTFDQKGSAVYEKTLLASNGHIHEDLRKLLAAA